MLHNYTLALTLLILSHDRANLQQKQPIFHSFLFFKWDEACISRVDPNVLLTWLMSTISLDFKAKTIMKKLC